MTTHRAILHLSYMLGYTVYGQHRQALEMAIEALRAQPQQVPISADIDVPGDRREL